MARCLDGYCGRVGSRDGEDRGEIRRGKNGRDESGMDYEEDGLRSEERVGSRYCLSGAL